MRRIKETPVLDVAETARFLKYVEQADPNNCWQWTGGGSDGYGVFSLKRNGRWQNYRATRIMYRIHYGTIDDTKFVAHRCDHPECMNPGHFFLTSHQGNMADLRFKNALFKAEVAEKLRVVGV